MESHEELQRQRQALKRELNATMDNKKGSYSEGSGGSSEGLTEHPELDLVLDIPVRVSLEVGGTKISIRDLLQLGQGSVVELDRQAGEPLDVLVNGKLIAYGEVVVVNDKLGIRLTEVVSHSDRLNSLR